VREASGDLFLEEPEARKGGEAWTAEIFQGVVVGDEVDNEARKEEGGDECEGGKEQRHVCK
jgi:hypothetical protein